MDELQVAWTFQTGEIPESTGGGLEDQNTPMQIRDTLYLCTAANAVIAPDNATGVEKWRTEFPTDTRVWMRCRGLACFDASAPMTYDVWSNKVVLPVGGAAGQICALDRLIGEPLAEIDMKPATIPNEPMR